MTSPVYLNPLSMIVQMLTNLGLPAVGGTVNLYVGGTVNTPATTYADSTGILPNPNPITLSSSGRMVAQSGAPIELWTVAGTLLKMVAVDAGNNTLFTLDNVPAINDPSSANSLQSLLASAASSNSAGSGPVAGVDLVSNAVKSYDIIADVRAANAPTLLSGQTLNIQLQGGLAVNDGLGGDFYWSATSTATDNGATVLKPGSVALSSPGRWLRLGTPPFGSAVNLAAAATTDLGTAGSNVVNITGGSAITSFGSTVLLSAPLYLLYFAAGGNVLTNSAALALPGGQNITTSAGDSALALYRGSSSWQIIAYNRLNTGPDGAVQYVATADQAVTSSTTLTPDTALVTGFLVPGFTYLVQLRLLFAGNTSTTQGYKAQLNFTGTVTGPAVGIGVASSNLTPAAVLVNLNTVLSEAAVSDTTGSPDMVSLDYLITPASGGTLQSSFAQVSSSGVATTRKVGSSMIVTRLD